MTEETIVMSAPSVKAANAAFRRHFRLDQVHWRDVLVNPGDVGLYRLSYQDYVAEVTIIRNKEVEIHASLY